MTFAIAPSRKRSKSRPTTSRRSALACIAAAAGLWLSGCATDRGISLPELSDWETRQRTLRAQSDWSFTGRIAVSSRDDGFNGRLRWQQRSESFDASLSGPLGAGAVQIRGDGQAITVTDNDGAVTVLEQPERDLRLRYGWTIPVNSLRFWALGIPDPDPDRPVSTVFGTDGKLERLEQGGWQVEIGQYREGGGQQMPRRITATNPDSRVRLVIDGWTFY